MKVLILMLSGVFFTACSLEAGEAAAHSDYDPAEENRIGASEETTDNPDEPPAVTLDDASLSEIYDLFSEYDREDAPGCAVAVYDSGETVFRGAFGMANLDYNIPLSDSSRFYMASVSKQVTAAAAGLLIVRGELDYEAGVSEYLENWPDWADGVRVKHLFNHTSGLPDIYDLMGIAGISLSNVMDLDDYIPVFLNGESLKNDPGEAYSYTNSGYTTLAKLVEEVSGDDFPVFVNDELLSPLGMKETHFHDDRYRVIPNRVISYAPVSNRDNENEDDGETSADSDEESIPPFRQTYLSNFQGVGPGGLYSTLKDWKHWEDFWLADSDLPDDFLELRRLMTGREVVDNDTLSYGMGLQIETWQGSRMEGHSGSFMGFKTDVRRFPEHGVAFLTLCNREDADPGEKNRALARIVLKEHFEAFLMPYHGTYHNEELQVDYELSVEEGALKLHRRLSPRGIMTEDEKDIWSAGSWEFVFQRNDQNEITGFVVSTGRAREVEFVKK